MNPNTIKRPNLRIHEVEGAQTKTKGIQNIINELRAENFPNHGKDMDVQIQEAHITLDRHDQKRALSCHIIVKILRLQNKKQRLKVSRNKANILTKSKSSELHQTSQQKP
jgi:hypothetical protein